MKHQEPKYNYFILPVILLTLLLGSCGQEEKGKEIVDLKCEYLVNPLGIDVVHPRLSWRMESTENGAGQTAYRILAATNMDLLKNETPDLWDSGKIESSQSIQVEYNGKPLNSGMKVFWKVQVWDEKGKKLNWSQSAYWEMGLLNKEDWQSHWIGAPDLLSKEEWKLPSPLFRKKIQIQKKIKRARVYISGLGYYELYINGKKVGNHVLSPNQTNYDRRDLQKWDEPRVGNMTTTVLYETYDITPNLQQGENALGVMLGNGWYIQADRPKDNWLWYDTPRLLAQFEVEYTDGSKQIIATDESWKTSLSPICYNGLHSGEIYDARMEQPGWDAPEFDDTNWGSASIVRSPTGMIKAQMSPSDRVTETIKPVSVVEIEKGIYRFDLGKMISGWARLKLLGAKGTEVKLRFVEELGPTYAQTDTYILKGEGTEIWEPRFTWHAFRYVEVSGFPEKLTVDNLEGRVVHTDVQKTGSFESSEPLLNQILKNYQSTQLGNMHGGIPSDCPHRERRGYTGDGQISAKAAIYNFDMASFYTKWLNDIRDAQNHKTGYVPNTTPYQDGGGGTAWGAAYIIIPWYMYQFYADVRILEQHYEGMKHWIEYMKNSLDKNGILANQGLGEWVPPEAVEVPPDFVNTCYYFHCCRLMEKVANVLQKENDKEYYSQLATNARYVINSTWFNGESSNYSIGRQGANIFPLGFGITSENKVEAVFKNLIGNVLKNKVHFDTGILATPLLLDVLTQGGRSDLAHTIMTQRDFPSFGYMIENGATTLWETWQGDASHSHPMFGSVCEWLFQSLGGISPDEEFPGFKHSIIRPYPVKSLQFVNASYPSLYGNITSKWEWKGNDYFFDVTVPANTWATVYVPAESMEAVTEGGKSILKNPFIQFVKMEKQNAVFEVQSGKYNFVSKDAKKMMKEPILPAPVIAPRDTLASVGDSVKVNISSGIDDANIFYTLDGSEPDTTSMLFIHPFYLQQPAEVKAKSFKNGYISSFAKSNKVSFMNPEVNGVTYQYYEGVWTELPDFSKLKSDKTGIVYAFGLDKINPQKDEFALRFTGKLKIERAGEYEFYIHSNDGSCLYIDKKQVVNHNGLHGAELEKSNKIRLEAGLHNIQLDYFQAGGGLFLQLEYAGPGIKKQDVPAIVLFQK
ncbi:family 78 glycoside hydrolase catalytic domain [Maribellus maritimus]|uniref:family 78 glycoside hydrolase catalytic domain n=1 Tax=Maribellus maritimus TaxID=2870838 RepID=UPI001EECDD55|nr:family 78 glycoside hydrolase catalytic domain [Maribellus maritimus]MCG6189323.1 family 78 glycoside hydrolase catalytic domain [Maribellus maritimus]